MDIRISCCLILVLGSIVRRITSWMRREADEWPRRLRQSAISMARVFIFFSLACIINYGLDLSAIRHLPSFWWRVLCLGIYWIFFTWALIMTFLVFVLDVVRGLTKIFDDY